MTKKLSSLLIALFVCLGFLASATPASASHLRGTSLSWAPTATAGQIQFTMQYSQRASAGGCSVAACSVGSTVQVPVTFGDGQSGTITTTVTSLNSAEDYFSSTGTILHTYTSAGPFLAQYSVCCRVSTIITGHDQTMQMQTLVSPFSSNHAPVVSMPAIITIPLQATTGFFITASDLDRDVLSYRLSTATEMYALGSFSCAAEQPPGLSVNATTGQVTWDTTRIVQAGCGFAAPKSGDIWTAEFMVQDLDAVGNVKSKVPLDIILKFVSSTEAPPTLALSNAGPFTIQAGTTLSFTATGADVAPNSRVTLNASGLPVGAVVTNVNQALTPPVSSVFTWTPTAAQGGSYVVTYTATNDTFEQVLASVTIFVQNIQPPVLTCSASLLAHYGQSLAIPLKYTDPQGDAVSVVWSVDGSIVRTDNLPAANGTTTDILNQVFTTLGTHAVSVTATDTDNKTASCSTPINVTHADQTITFGALPNVTYGAASSSLIATASSGLPVAFTAAGSCSITGGAVHADSVGSCTVTATQAGDANNNPAPQVQQSFTIATATLSVTAADANSVYGAATPSFTGTINGIVNGDAITATYASAATPASNVGTYAIVPTLSGAALSNYTVTSTNGTLTVTPASLSVSAANATSVYGSALPAFTGTINGIVNNDAITAAYNTAATSASNVGTYAITPVLSGAALSNYTVTSNNGTLTITPASLSVTAANATSVYGSALPALTGTLNGIVNGDDITAIYNTVATSASNVGTYAITASVSGAALSNYTVISSNGTLTITPAPLSVSAANATMVYGSALPAFTGTITGIVNGDAITATYATDATSASNVGSYTITPSIFGASFSNYTLTSNNGTLTITPATLSVTAANATSIYGSALPAFTGVVNGTVNGDTISVSYTTTATSASGVGSYAIVPVLSGPALANYTATLTNGTLTIGKATASVTPNAATKVYGTADPVFTGTLSGFVAADGVTATYTRTSGTTVGTYVISATLSPAAALANYNLTSNTASFTITKATPSLIWATPAAITYGTALGAAQLNASSNAAGTFSYSPATGTFPAGTQLLTVTFTPTDAADYTTASAQVTLTINKATPTITWANPANLNYGKPLTATQLNATASVAGTFFYSPAAGALLNGGNNTLNVTFTPTDTANYTSATKSVTIFIVASTVNTGVASGNQTYPTWTNFVLGPVWSGNRAPTGTVTLYNNGVAITTMQLGGDGKAYYTTQPPLNVGVNNLTVSYSGDAYFAPGLSSVTTITVLPAQVNFQATCQGQQVYNNNNPLNCQVSLSASTPTPPVGVITYTLDGGAPVTVAINGGNAPFTVPGVLPAGNHTLVLSYAATTNYAAAGPLTRTITTQQAATQIQMTPSSYYIASGSSFTLNASATTPSSGAPQGSITFYDNGRALTTVTADGSGRASYTFPITKGSHNFYATFGATPNYAGATSGSAGITAY